MENPQNQHPRIVPPNPPRDTNLEEFNDEFKYANASEGNELVVDGIDYDADSIIDDFDIFDEY